MLCLYALIGNRSSLHQLHRAVALWLSANPPPARSRACRVAPGSLPRLPGIMARAGSGRRAGGEAPEPPPRGAASLARPVGAGSQSFAAPRSRAALCRQCIHAARACLFIVPRVSPPVRRAGLSCPALAGRRIHAPASALSPWPLAGLNGHVRGARRGLGWLAPALRRAGVLPCCVLLLLLFGPLRFGGWCCGRRCGRCGAGWRGLRIAVRGVAGRRAVR